MKENYAKIKEYKNKFTASRWAKILLKAFGALIVVIILAYVSLAWYINTHKKEVLSEVTQTLNENLTGTISIGDIEPTFLQGFPMVSLRLENVVLRDSLYEKHNHTLLKAGALDLSLNALAFIRGAIVIRRVSISDATIDLYTDANGYTNSKVFRKSPKKESNVDDNAGYPQLKKILLDNVNFFIENQKMGKLYKFKVESLRGDMDYSSSGFDADIRLKTLVQSMAFSTRKGSFIQDKIVSGTFDINFDEDKELITIKPNDLDIGGEDFIIGATFKTGGPKADYSINIENKKITWRNASHLLSPNITSRLDMFNFSEPIRVKCDIIGDFNIKGDPLIRVNAFIENNELTTKGGVIKDCSFTGVFTNNHDKSKGFNDANSAVKLFNFKGKYGEIPLNMQKVFILDFEKPIALGDFTSEFPIEKLNSIIDADLMKFSGGSAKIAVNFRADIVNYMISKPLVNGNINITKANVGYIPRKLDFKDVTVALNFTQDNLSISKINLKTGKSIITMQGSIDNFLNLYYTAPEKIILKWNIYSPQLHMGEFMAFLGSRDKSRVVKKKPGQGNFTEELNMLFDRSNVDIKMRVDKLFYNKFRATDARADVLLTANGIAIKNAGLRHAGGRLLVNGNMVQSGKVNKYNLNADVNNVDIRQFFEAFDNFGVEAMKAGNLRGNLSSKASLSGSITDAGAMVPKSIYGNVNFKINKGALVDFDPVRKIGKFAFPFRDMNNIVFTNLTGNFDVKGDKVTIAPMQINSSVLNMDVAGVYAFNKGTNIYIDVPLRDPKRDKDITDDEELAKRRNKGIVVHLIAADGDDGKVGIKLGSKKKDK